MLRPGTPPSDPPAAPAVVSPESKGLEVIVLGSSGGPIERSTSAFLVKSTATSWLAPNCLLAVDAGCLLSGIIDILETQREAHSKDSPEVFPISSCAPLAQRPNVSAHHVVTELLGGICLTHQHLDHIAGLILNSVCFSPQSPKTVAALPGCIDALVNHVFNGSIWPNLSNETPTGPTDSTGHFLAFKRLEPKQTLDEIALGLSITVYPVSHGTLMTGGLAVSQSGSSLAAIPSSTSLCEADSDSPSPHASSYESAAYFVTDATTGKMILMWGDVEADCVSLTPHNASVWQAAAHHIHAGKLVAVFIECSYSLSRPDELLYGHLNPNHLVRELSHLASLAGSLRGLTVVLTHIKEELKGHEEPHSRILQEVQSLASAQGLECSFRMAAPGQKYVF